MMSTVGPQEPQEPQEAEEPRESGEENDGVEPRHDYSHLVDQLQVFLLGEGPTLTGLQIAEAAGISMETARNRWRSLGFTAVGDDVVAFTQADLEAMCLTEELNGLGLVDPADESALVRALGRSFARLAEWQMGLLARTVDIDTMDVEEIGALMGTLTPAVERLQNYVWRRHTLNVAARLLLMESTAPPRGVEKDAESREPVTDSAPLVVGFADIVDYTRQSRSLSMKKLTALVDAFEARALSIITEQGGRIIKTIGDEILFVADEPDRAALIGLLLTEERLRDEDFPELRVGMAWGPALARLGDVYGPVVNVASRLTSIARPGRVLVDRSLAEELRDNDHLRLRRLRRASVRGYRRLEPWSLRRPADEDPELIEDGQLPPASQILSQYSKDILRAFEEGPRRPETRSSDEAGEESTD